MGIAMLTHQQCVEIAARVWCDPLLSDRVMDSVAAEELALHIGRIVNPEEVPANPIQPTFESELCALINRYSKENGSNTPDFILAEYLLDCLATWNTHVTRRTKWYSPDPLESPSLLSGLEN